jgi:hypothetical protein
MASLAWGAWSMGITIDIAREFSHGLIAASLPLLRVSLKSSKFERSFVVDVDVSLAALTLAPYTSESHSHSYPRSAALVHETDMLWFLRYDRRTSIRVSNRVIFSHSAVFGSGF